MRVRVALWWENLLSVFKYLVATLMILSAIQTATLPLAPAGAPLGIIYSSRFSLVILGIIFGISGVTLLYGKIRRDRLLTGRGLLLVYLCFLFAAIIQGVAYAWHPGYWMPNAIMAVIMGLLWLRWKFKTSYVNPKHFKKLIETEGLHKHEAHRIHHHRG